MRTNGRRSKSSPIEGANTTDIDELIWDGAIVDSEAKRAVREALLTHKKLGQCVVVWKDGKPVRLKPEEI